MKQKRFKQALAKKLFVLPTKFLHDHIRIANNISEGYHITKELPIMSNIIPLELSITYTTLPH